jgi:hypothetical protein
MALSKKFLRTLGLEEDKVDEIFDRHTESVVALKDEIDKYKADAEKLPSVENELAELKANIDDTAGDKDGYKEKYDKLQKEYEAYKSEQEQKEKGAKVKEAYKALLEKTGVSSKRINSILKVTNLSDIKLDKDGNIEGSDKLKEGIKKEWEDFIETKFDEGADTSTPPEHSGGTKSKEEILKIKDTGERQKEIAKNHELFGF